MIHTFFVGSSRYNTNLWTIKYELFGSYLAWTLAVVVVALRRRVLACMALAIATAWAAWMSSVYAAFSGHFVFEQSVDHPVARGLHL